MKLKIYQNLDYNSALRFVSAILSSYMLSFKAYNDDSLRYLALSILLDGVVVSIDYEGKLLINPHHFEGPGISIASTGVDNTILVMFF